jgi:hypothetical protein
MISHALETLINLLHACRTCDLDTPFDQVILEDAFVKLV